MIDVDSDCICDGSASDIVVKCMSKLITAMSVLWCLRIILGNQVIVNASSVVECIAIASCK